MTIGLVDLVFLIGLLFQRLHCRPRTRPCGRIFDSYRVLKPILAYAFEALDHVSVLTRAQIIRLGREVRNVDDQRVALPMAARIPLIGPDARRQVLAAVDRNCADETLPLERVHYDADLSWRLHDAIERVQMRQLPGQTALLQSTVFRTVSAIEAVDVIEGRRFEKQRGGRSGPATGGPLKQRLLVLAYGDPSLLRFRR